MSYSLEDIKFSATTGATLGGLLGGLPGAVVGGLGGALSVVAGWGVSKAAKGMGLSPETAETLGRIAELITPVGGLSEATGLGRDVLIAFSKAPHVLKLGMKAAMTAGAFYYVAEPYLEDEYGGEKPYGMAALAGLGWLYARKFRPLGTWALYGLRRKGAELTEGKWVPDVLYERGEEWKPIKKFGIEFPGLKKGQRFMESLINPFQELDVEVGARDIINIGLPLTKRLVAEHEYRLKRVVESFERAGIKPGEKGRELGKLFFRELESAKEIRDRLVKAGVPEAHIEDVADSILDLIEVNNMMKEEFVKLGGAEEKYLDIFGNEKRVFQHLFPRREKKEFIDEPLKNIETEDISVVKGEATTYRRGMVVQGEEKKNVFEAFEKEFGRPMQEGDRWTSADGKVTYHYVKTRADRKQPVLIKETPPTEGVIADLAASVYKQLSEDVNLLRRLKFFGWLRMTGEAHGLVKTMPAPGFKKVEGRVEGQRVINRYGLLTDTYVAPEIYRMARYFMHLESYTPKLKFVAQMNRIYKNGYLSLNWRSYVNAFLGNMVLSFVNGLDPLSVLWHYAKGLGKEDNLFEEAIKEGVFRKEWQFDESVYRDKQKLLSIIEDKDAPLWKRIFQATDEILANWMNKAYGKIDNVFRYGAYRLLRERGLPAHLAAEKSTAVYGYYGDMPILVRHLRDTLVPFISFQWRIYPQLFKAAFNRPERFAAVVLFTEGLQRAAFKETYGENWREGMNYERLVNQAYLKPRIAGMVGDFIRVPSIGDIPGGYMYAGFLPWNIPLSIPHAQTDAGWIGFLPTIFIQNPWIRFVNGVIWGIDPSTGRRVLDMAGPGRVNASVLQFFLRTVAPSPIVGHYLGQLFAKEGWFDPIIAWFNYYGTYPDGTPVGTAHMIWNTLAPTVLKYDPDFNLEMALRRLQAVENQYKRTFYKALYRRAPLHVLAERWEDLERAHYRTWEKKASYIEAYMKAHGIGGKK